MDRLTKTTYFLPIDLGISMQKLTPKFIGSYQILKRKCFVAYELVLPPSLANTDNIFHVSQLRKYVLDLSHILEYASVQVK